MKKTIKVFVFCTFMVVTFAANVFCESKIAEKSCSVYFNFAKSDLTDTSREILNEFVRGLKGLEIDQVMITGYTCSVGTKERNLELSKKRANAVYEYMKNAGVGKKELYMIVARGQLEYIVSNEIEDKKKVNRQVKVQVFYKKPVETEKQ